MAKIQCLTHVPFENAANIHVWAQDNSHDLQYTHLYRKQHFPDIEDFDILAIMGGLMNIYEHDKYPWLIEEKKFIAQAIEKNKKVVGICLGAQLLADVLGGKVTQNKYKEIGWFDINLTDHAKNSSLFSSLPEQFTAFQWHGDTFTIPPGAVNLATNQTCQNQAFQYSDNVIALQFHLDYSQHSIEEMLENCSDELVDAPYIQTEQQIRDGYHRIPQIKGLLYKCLDALCQN